MFGPEADNAAVACRLALPLVGPALSGVNGTIFAYGVTSSGKTHTMMGTDQVSRGCCPDDDDGCSSGTHYEQSGHRTVGVCARGFTTDSYAGRAAAGPAATSRTP